MEVMDLSFPIPQSTVTFRFGNYETLLQYLFLRVYGYRIPGEKYPRPTIRNITFNQTLDYIFKNISLGIVGKARLQKSFQNADGLYLKLIVLQRH